MNMIRNLAGVVIQEDDWQRTKGRLLHLITMLDAAADMAIQKREPHLPSIVEDMQALLVAYQILDHIEKGVTGTLEINYKAKN